MIPLAAYSTNLLRDLKRSIFLPVPQDAKLVCFKDV